MIWCIYNYVLAYKILLNDEMNSLRKACFVWGSIQVILLTILNYYWYVLIIIKLGKIFGIIKKNDVDSDADSDYEKVEKDKKKSID